MIGVSQTSLMVGGFRSKALWHCEGKKLIPWWFAVVEISCHDLSDCRHPSFRNLNSTVPVDVVRVKSHDRLPAIYESTMQ